MDSYFLNRSINIISGFSPLDDIFQLLSNIFKHIICDFVGDALEFLLSNYAHNH